MLHASLKKAVWGIFTNQAWNCHSQGVLSGTERLQPCALPHEPGLKSETLCRTLGGLQVVQAIGAAETKLLDFGAPSRIDGKAATKLVNVAKDLNVQQYIMVSSLGTGKIGFPASESCRSFSTAIILIATSVPSAWLNTRLQAAAGEQLKACKSLLPWVPPSGH